MKIAPRLYGLGDKKGGSVRIDADSAGVGHADPIIKDGAAVLRELVKGKMPRAELAGA